MPPLPRRAAAALLVALVSLLATPAGAAPPVASPPSSEGRWAWPGGEPTIVAPYDAPDHDYGAGHRGVDVAASGEIVAPDDGIVAFAGAVAGRPLLTIDHGAGLVSTLEPVDPTVAAGDVVSRGQVVGTLDEGGHVPPGAVHLGARLDGEYIDPTALLGAAERPVLLPCC